MKLHRISALIARHLYLYKRSPPRIMEIFYWPFLDLVIWGFITVYLTRSQGSIPGAVTFFLGALILWDVLFRAQQGITISFLEELWARNLMNLFASPLTPNEFLAATMVMSLLKVAAVSVVMAVSAWLFYSYNVLLIGLALVPFVVSLIVTGMLTLLLGSVADSWMSAAVIIQPAFAVWFFPAGFAALAVLAPPQARNLAVGFTIPFGYLIGGGVIPTFIGVMGDAHLFATGFIVTGILIIAAGVLALTLKLPDGGKTAQ